MDSTTGSTGRDKKKKNYSSIDDARKKRDSREVVAENALNIDEEQQKSKKKPRERKEEKQQQSTLDDNKRIILHSTHKIQKSSPTSNDTTSSAITTSYDGTVSTTGTVSVSNNTNNNTDDFGNNTATGVIAPVITATADVLETIATEGVETRLSKLKNTTPTKQTNTKTAEAETETATLLCHNKSNRIVYDIENALHQIVQLSEGVHEPISNDGTIMISFRIGHAGDATALAKMIRCSNKSNEAKYKNHYNDNKKDENINSIENNTQEKDDSVNDEKEPSKPTKEEQQQEQQQQQTQPTQVRANNVKSTVTTDTCATTAVAGGVNSNEDTTLEVSLADGLGDEDAPPYVFALIVDMITTAAPTPITANNINSNKTSFPTNNTDTSSSSSSSYSNSNNSMVGAALFTTSLVEQSKVLLIEWIDIVLTNSDNISSSFFDKTTDPTTTSTTGTNTALKGIIERRLWLRLCTLSILLSCERIVIVNQYIQQDDKNQHNNIVKSTPV